MTSVEPVLRAVIALSAVTALCALMGCASGAPRTEVTDRASSATPSPINVTTAVEAKAKPAAPAPVDARTQAQFDQALQAQRAGRNDEALRLWAAFTLAHPEIGAGHANLGLLHRQAGRDAEAVAALERAVKASPEQPRLLNELGIAFRAAGQFAKAQQAYETALALDPQHAPSLLNLGILLDLYLGESARALALYERYLALPAAAGNDPPVTKWAADLRQRKPAVGTAPAASATQVAANAKEPR